MPANMQEILGIKVVADTKGAIKGIDTLTQRITSIDKAGNMTVKTLGTMGDKTVEMTTHMNRATKSITTATREVEDFNKGLFRTGDSFGKIIAKVTQWTVATGLLFGSVRALRGGLDTIVDVDDRMVMLNKVFQGTSQQLRIVKEDALDVSVSMGNLVASSIDATTEWAKMGRVGTELSQGLQASLLAQNIAEIDAADAAKLLNAAMLQFNKTMDQAIEVLDEWNELSNRTPATTRDLAASVQQAGAIFQSAGATIQDLNAYTAALSASMAKSGKEIGSALKTIGSYIRRQSSLSKISEIAGVSIEREGGQLLELDDIILQLSGTWQNLTDIQKEEIAQTAAGVRRKAFFLNLMDNFNLVLENYAIQWEAAGSALKENEIRLDSLRTKLTQLTASVEALAVKTGDKGLIGVLKSMTDGIRKNIDTFGELSGTMQLLNIGVGVFGGAIAGNIIRLKSWNRAIKVVLGGTASMLGKMTLIGVALTAAAFAIDRINEAMVAEKRALQELNEEREKRLSKINQEIAVAKTAKQQYEIFKALYDRLKEVEEKGGDTSVIMQQLSQVWESINDVDPTILRNVDSIDEAVKTLEINANKASKAMDDLVSDRDELSRTGKILDIINSVEGLDELKFTGPLKTARDYGSRFNLVEPTALTAVTKTFEEGKNPFTAAINEGDVNSAINLLKHYRVQLDKLDITSKDWLMRVKQIEDAIEDLQNIDVDPNAFPGGDGTNPAFNSDDWDALASAMKRVGSTAESLSSRYESVLNKQKTSLEIYQAALGGKDGPGIRESVAEVSAEIIDSQEKIADLMSKRTDVATEAADAERIQLETNLELYDRLLDALAKLIQEERKIETQASNQARKLKRLQDAVSKSLGEAVITGLYTGFSSDRTMVAMRNFSDSLGSMLGSSTETFITKAASGFGSLAGPLGSIAGSGVGALISLIGESLFGEETEPEKLADELERNTLALIDNTDAFQDFQERLINAPASFALPALAGDTTSNYSGGTTTDYNATSPQGTGNTTLSKSVGTVNVNVSGSGDPEAVSKAVVRAIDEAYDNGDVRGKNLTQDF